jgi:hypothetical protein
MKWFKLSLSALFIPFGLLCLLIIATSHLDPKASREEKVDITVGGLIMGLPSLLLGGGLVFNVYQQEQRKKRQQAETKNQHLQGVFYQLVTENEGKLSVLKFAMATHLSSQEAQEYLDQKAKEFNANFEVDEKGNIFYHFSII